MDYVSMSEWVEKVIHSCHTNEHFRSAERLIDNYKRMYGAGDHDLHKRLQCLLEVKKLSKEIY